MPFNFQGAAKHLHNALSLAVLMILMLMSPAWCEGKHDEIPKPATVDVSPAPKEDSYDLYGVVLSTKDLGIAPGSALVTAPQPDKHGKPKHNEASAPGGDRLQGVTIQLDLATRPRALKQEIVTAVNAIEGNPGYTVPLKPGVRVLINAEHNASTGKWEFSVMNRDRSPAILILGTLVVLAVLLIGGPEVAKHGLLVILMMMGIYRALYPAITSGHDGAQWILLLCFMFIILASFIYQPPGTKSFSREQSVVILGTSGGLLIATIILAIMHVIAPLDGYSSEALLGLWYDYPHLDYWLLYCGSVIVGFLGFLFYLCWTLAQRRVEPKALTFQERFSIIMMRGRRQLGPLLSSLCLLFLGLLMPALLQLANAPSGQFIAQESTASLLTFAFAGLLSVMLTVPLTALIAAWRYTD